MSNIIQKSSELSGKDATNVQNSLRVYRKKASFFFFPLINTSFCIKSSTEGITLGCWAAEKVRDWWIHGRKEIQCRKEHPWEEWPLTVGYWKLWYPSRARARCCHSRDWPLGTTEKVTLETWCNLPLQADSVIQPLQKMASPLCIISLSFC